MGDANLQEALRLIGNRAREMPHPVTRGSPGIREMARATILLAGCGRESAEAALRAIEALLNLPLKDGPCRKCKGKLLLFAHRIATANGLGEQRRYRQQAFLTELPQLMRDYEVGDLDDEIDAVLTHEREHPEAEA